MEEFLKRITTDIYFRLESKEFLTLNFEEFLKKHLA